MGTAATATSINGVSPSGGGLYKGFFTVALDTTDASGLQTLDLTSYFSKIYGISIVGELAATENGYQVKPYLPAYGTAISATNVSLGFYQSAGAAAEMASVDSTDMSALITGLTIKVEGKAVGNAT
jgi:hypothetical protein